MVTKEYLIPGAKASYCQLLVHQRKQHAATNLGPICRNAVQQLYMPTRIQNEYSEYKEGQRAQSQTTIFLSP